MKVRVYDGGKGYSVDRYSLYFPLPKKEVEETYRIHRERISGHFLGFGFNDDCIFRCCWDEWNMRNGYCTNLGKKVKIETLPQHVQEWVRGYEKAWNNLLKHPNDERYQWEWENYF